MTAMKPIAHAPSIQDIQQAREVIRASVLETPMLHSQTFSAMSGANVYLKPENLQKAGSFKVRGATYKISRLSEGERARGVVATSMGNHAQAVAIAARALDVSATIVMPEQAPLVKVTATQGYGARVILHGATFEDAYIHARVLQEETGATFIHSFDDADLIAGQGSLGLEILTQLPTVDAIVVPVGGGGLIAGIALAVKALRPEVKIIGVQASGADALKRSLEQDRIVTLHRLHTIADGIRINSPGVLPFAILRSYLDEIVVVDDKEIVSALLLLLERCKLQVEGAGSTGLAALLHPGLLDLAGKNVVLLLSGGNIDINLLGGFIEYGLVAQGRITTLRTLLDDRPGELKRLLTLIADLDINVREMTYYRSLQPAPVQQNEVTLMLETRNHDHLEQLLNALREQAYDITQVRVSPRSEMHQAGENNLISQPRGL